jgi:hypothetical protein
MTEPKPDPIATARGLTDALKATAAEVERLRKYGRTNRKFVVVDVALTVLLAVVGLLSAHAVSQSSAASVLATQNHTAQIAICQSGNQARAQNEQLWNFIIALSTSSPPRPGETAAQKAAGERIIGLLKAKVTMTFKSRNCQQLTNGKKP